MNRWIDAIACRVIGHAAGRTPMTLTERLREEWLADLWDQRGRMARLKHALGCCWAALLINDDYCVASVAAAGSPSSDRMVMTDVRHRISLFSQQPVAAGSDADICEINTTPLVDILLVLLVTLIVSLPLMTHAVRIDLPQLAPHHVNLQREVIDPGINFDGTVVWNGSAVASLAQLEDYFRAESQKNPQPEIHLRPDRHVKYDVVAKVLAAAQRNGVTNLGFFNTAELGD
jgi:biopolymer transport protein ExbD